MAEHKTVTYDLKQVTRWVLTRAEAITFDAPAGTPCRGGSVSDIAEFRRHDEAVRVMNSLRHADPECFEPQEPAPCITVAD